MKTSVLLIGAAIGAGILFLRRSSPGVPVGEASPAAGASPLGPSKTAAGSKLVKPSGTTTPVAPKTDSWWSSVANVPTKIASGLITTTTTVVKGVASPGPIASAGPGKGI